MKTKTIALAKQLLDSVPKAEISDLIMLLTYYNDFAEGDRVKAMRVGSREPANRQLEGEIQESLSKTAGSQNVYVMTSQDVCRCCGK